jgi:hypothetical protein
VVTGRRRAAARGAVLLAAAVLSGACAAPAARFAARAADLGLERSEVSGGPYAHIVYARGPRVAAAPLLHVYLDGDGTPWRRGHPEPDPTPREPLVLELMARDPGAARYLGRPCYHGLGARSPCAPRDWNEGRYAPEVVASLAAAVRALAAEAGSSRVALLGHSGGGTLAMLVAPRVPEVVAVVTVAANLDVEAWAAAREIPLSGSLDPARLGPLPAGIVQRHYAGGRDRVVPPALVARAPIPPGSLRVVAEFDHVCCWRERWPEILAELRRALGPP